VSTDSEAVIAAAPSRTPAASACEQHRVLSDN
jgi:hypothetical protein